MALSIDDLLNSLQDPSRGLNGSPSEIWKRISNNKDNFDELGLEQDELDNLLKEWIEANPYSSL